MNLLPLLSRELVASSRRASTRNLKLGFGAGSMLVAIWSLLVSNGTSGRTIFLLLSGAAALLAMSAALVIASDTISRERREGTLGFLFLTDLRSLDVVAGKFAAAGLVPGMALLAMFPAFALCQLIGGVPAGLFWKMMAALVLTLAFSLSAALYVSAFCEDHRKAYSGATLLLLLLNPLLLCFAATVPGGGVFAVLAVLFGGLALVFLRNAAARLTVSWRDKMVEAQAGERALAPKFTHRWLERSPVTWMMSRRQRGNRSARAWGFLAIGVAGLVCASSAAKSGGEIPALAKLVLIHLGYAFLLIARTSYSFYADRQTGALELMLGSRLKNEEIFEGINRFVFARCAPAMALLTVIDIFCAAALWRSAGSGWAVWPIALGVVLWITLAGLGWLGVYRSLMMKNPSMAMMATFTRLSLVPILFSILFLMVPQTNSMKVAAFYILSSAVLAMFFSIDAKNALVVHGRTLLLRPQTEKPPHIEGEWSFIDWGADAADEMETVNHAVT